MMRPIHPFFGVLAACLLLFMQGCTPSTTVVSDQFPELSRRIESEFGLEKVRNRMQGDSLMHVSLINAPVEDLSQQDKQLLAFDVALYAWEESEGLADPEVIVVTFVTHHNYVVFQYTDESDAYPFRTEDLVPEMRGAMEFMMNILDDGKLN